MTNKRRLKDSIELISAFRFEQTDPDAFYGLLAKDAIKYLENYIDLTGFQVLDVGGGAGYFTAGFLAKGAFCIALEPDEAELTWRKTNFYSAVIADGFRLPFKDNSFDLCFSSNVLEHVKDPISFLKEMLRVTKFGGYVFACYTNWLSPWGGHETSPWHYFGGHWARKRYERKYQKQPKNIYEKSLFPINVEQMIKFLKSSDLEIIDLSPRYYPSWAKWIIYMPIVREFLTWNLAMLVRKCTNQI